MIVTYSDGSGLVLVTIDHSGISCDGTFMFFTDTAGRDYKIQCTDVFSIANDDY